MTDYDQWLERPYQDAEAAQEAADADRERLLKDLTSQELIEEMQARGLLDDAADELVALISTILENARNK